MTIIELFRQSVELYEKTGDGSNLKKAIILAGSVQVTKECLKDFGLEATIKLTPLSKLS